jgi:uncharacterized membrane protein YjjB (DUF3815 family)
MNTLDWIGFVVQDALWSAVAAAGFAILFNVPARTLPGCAIGGAIGHAVRSVLMRLGMDIELATLFSAAVIGLVGTLFARRWLVPTTIFTVSAAIPLVPGGFAYRTMIGLIELSTLDADASMSTLLSTVSNAIKTAFILGAIALGIAIPRLLFSRQKPVV